MRCAQGRQGPSDIDHVLHNGRSRPERVAFLEYKDGPQPPMGQKWLLDSLSGDWVEERTGRRLLIRYYVLPQHTEDPMALLLPIVRWVWPDTAEAHA